MAMPLTVLTRVSADAPPSRAATAISTMSVTLGLSLAHAGRPRSAATTAAIASRVADGSEANMCRPPSRLGQLRLTSTATTAAGAAAASAAAAFS